MDTTNLSEEEKAQWWLFIKANPIGVDPNIVGPKDIAQLPENVKTKLMDEKTSALIYLLGSENGLDEDKISDIARIVRDIALGDTRSADLTKILRDRLGVDENIAQTISSKLTSEIIAPNYFQISQLYERKHRSGKVLTQEKKPEKSTPLSGRPLDTVVPQKKEMQNFPEKPVSSMDDWAGDTEENQSEIVPNKPSKNVVDLRSNTIQTPTKLPPAPPLAPRNPQNE